MENLTPETWGNAIIGGQTPEMVVHRLRSRMFLPWFQDILSAAMNASEILAGPVLELGSGTGELSSGLALYGFHPCLIDFSKDALKFSMKVIDLLQLDPSISVIFSEADVTKTLPFSDNSVNMVFSSGLIEHFDHDEQNHIIREAFRVARHSVLTLVPNAGSIPYRLGKWLQEKEGTWKWGREDPFFTLDDVYRNVGISDFSEWTTAPYHALRFLDGAKKSTIAEMIRQMYEEIEKDPYQNLSDLEQGYLLVSVAYKNGVCE